MLDLSVRSRYSIYVGSETQASLIVDAELSYMHGAPYVGSPPNSSSSPRKRAQDQGILYFNVTVNGKLLTPDRESQVLVNSTGNEMTIGLASLTPRFEDYPVVLTASTCPGVSAAAAGCTAYEANTTLRYLPDKTNGGSVVRVDSLYGGLQYRNGFTNGTFQAVFPYGFYGSYSGHFNDTSTYAAYAARGFNALNPVTAFTDGDMTASLRAMDAANVLFQYDMRNSYRNLTSVAEQVPLVRDHPSLLTWYTADEPDGWEYDLNSTALARALLRDLDPYHPVALVLNCQNYFFAEYAAGADVLMEDAYPIGINATYSYRGTPCNATYGDCGCDNCAGSLLDVPARVDAFRQYGRWLRGGPDAAAAHKPVWAVPQAFSGEGYWAREPTPDEVWVMDLAALSHGAKGRLAWLYPPSAALDDAASRLARVVTAPRVTSLLTGAMPRLLVDGMRGGLDVGLWAGPGTAGEALVAVANPNNRTEEGVVVKIPEGLGALSMAAADGQGVVWGDVKWTLDAAKGELLPEGGSLKGLATSLIVLGATEA